MATEKFVVLDKLSFSFSIKTNNLVSLIKKKKSVISNISTQEEKIHFERWSEHKIHIYFNIQNSNLALGLSCSIPSLFKFQAFLYRYETNKKHITC